MTSGDLNEAEHREPLGLWQRSVAAPGDAADLRVRLFEYSSRGARVPGRLLLPAEGDGPFPLVVLQHGARGSKDAAYMLPVAAPWARAGAAVASIDLPLHGERRNAKLSGLLLGALGLEGRPTPAGRTILDEFVRQAVCDLRRLVDVAAALPQVDGERVVFAGLSLGSIVGATYVAHDPRPRAAALALGGGGFGGPDTDPTHHVHRIAPRPLLFVNATRDETVPRSATEALYDAACEPKEIHWFDSGHQDLPGKALKTMWQFLRGHLELA
ncbi:MAG: alpha/beta hydrolase [Myxococcota bacterium]